MADYLVSYDELCTIFGQAGFKPGAEEYKKFALYAKLLVETNEKFNLTAITEPRDIAIKHFLDSVLPLRMVELPKGCMLCDVGSGAGFPGVPMAIMRPDLRVTLIDSLLKRVNFLNMLCTELNVPANCIHTRAEDAGKSLYYGAFDVVTARAVSKLDKLAGYCLPLLKPGGLMLALKGAECKEEVSAAEPAIKKYGGALDQTNVYGLPNGDGRTLVVIRKVRG